MWPSASTRLVALLGWPVEHSVSPSMHNAAFRELDIDMVYVALPVQPPHLAAAMEGLAAVGALGANVTVPHKQAVIDLCDSVTDEVELVGAANTMSWGPDGLVGDNTDARGLAHALDDHGVPPGTGAIVLGTGGAARATVVALGRQGRRVVVVGRRLAAAGDLAALARRAGAPAAESTHPDDSELSVAIGNAGLIVNATPLGMNGERLPDAFHALHAGQVAYDLVYTPTPTPFLAAAREVGAEAHGGISMLVAQAELSFETWTGHPAPAGLMSAHAVAALGIG